MARFDNNTLKLALWFSSVLILCMTASSLAANSKDRNYMPQPEGKNIFRQFQDNFDYCSKPVIYIRRNFILES